MSARQSRCYLSGMDWFVRAMDRNTQASTGVGNYSQIVLTLNGRLDSEDLRQRLARLIENHPLLTGRCRRNPLNLAPYWDIPQPRDGSCDSLLDDLPPDAPAGPSRLPMLLIDQVNRPLPGRCRVGFSLIRANQGSSLAMRFDHQVLDAVGAERLLQHLADTTGNEPALALDERPSHLNNWIGKFKSGQKANRALLALRGPTPPVSLPLPPRRHAVIPSRFMIHRFDETESREIIKRSERHTGYLLLLPYLLGICVRAFDRLTRRMGRPGNHYVVPVTMNARRSSHPMNVFFNRLSFHFYRFDRPCAGHPEAVWESATTQLYRQTRDQLSDHIAQAGYLMRILPAVWLGRLMCLPLSGLGSFSFSLINGNGFERSDFMGHPVTRIAHLPRVPAPPGIGMFFTRHQGCLTLVISYLDGMLDTTQAHDLVRWIVEALLDGEAA